MVWLFGRSKCKCIFKDVCMPMDIIGRYCDCH